MHVRLRLPPPPPPPPLHPHRQLPAHRIPLWRTRRCSFISIIPSSTSAASSKASVSLEHPSTPELHTPLQVISLQHPCDAQEDGSQAVTTREKSGKLSLLPVKVSVGWAAGLPLSLWRMILWMKTEEMALGELLERLRTVTQSIDQHSPTHPGKSGQPVEPTARGSFPGNLQLVLVLRPTTLLQRALSDILFKFNKDEFKMKVIMLSSVTELHSYIDRSQLTQELGGTQEYCHEKWISHRTAIEGFAVMVKKTAQTLQSFGTELAETELPSEIQATTVLLSTHTTKKEKMKGDLLVALGQGSRLLESINEPVVRDPDHNMNQDELENLATVQRLLSQLDETERAFDEFWVRHQTKLEQCLQLRHFEHDYREVRALLDQVSEKLATFSEVGISPAHADHIFCELTTYEERVCEVLDRASSLARDGDELIQKSHYAEDSIQPNCSEVRALSENVSSNLRAKKDHLLKAMELHHCLERASKWVDDGIYLLASQPVDKCQSHEGAELALQELERYLDHAGQNQLTDLSTIWREYEAVLNQQFRDQVEKVFQKQTSMQEMFDKRRVSLKKLAAKQTRPVQPVAPRPEAFIKSPLSSPAHRAQQEKICPDTDSGNNCEKENVQLQNGDGNSRHVSLSEEEENLAVLRRHVMNELLETERAYVEELLCVLQGYASEMDNPAMLHLMPAPLQNKKEVLFGNMPEIYHFHRRTFLRELEQYTDCPELVGRCFLERMTDLQIYEKYCHNKPRSESLWRQCSDCAFFQECQKKLEHKLGLDSYLLKPVQRITKYQLLLKEMLKYSKTCEGADDLQEALTSILGILKAVNDSMHLIAITGYEVSESQAPFGTC
ncbi:Guanine nucleotide exchange factor DBS DBL's big sister MCF2-transforming sequence-like protein [Collichthys lucidus]|uniref:Guanine nucleotide exchange factor DBS DBL's big sister MCF2-transforming sequence-like protein n=1 Tax=Collichthys lucidus TaxID=240159 RepID=A0A4U5TYP7_COLLU|nr:Guanine nucleotide exchange factor DBS DBL's big sister MCF2-transforming sequence-like protein [Collichthys lucidus]